MASTPIARPRSSSIRPHVPQVTPLLYDSKWSQPQALLAFSDMYARSVPALVGPSISGLALQLASLGRVFDIPQLSYWASSPQLSQRQADLFARTYQSDSVTVDELLTLLSHSFGWHNIGVVHEATSYGSSYSGLLEKRAGEYRMGVVSQVSFEPGGSARDAIAELKTSRLNVFVAVCLYTDCLTLFQEAFTQGLLGAGFAWIVADGLTVEQVNSAPPNESSAIRPQSLDGVLRFYSSPALTDGYRRFSARWRSARQLDCANSLFNVSTAPPLFESAPFEIAAFLYDAVVATSVALGRTVRFNASGGGDASDRDAWVGTEVYSALLNVSFEGASGQLTLDAQGDRAAATVRFNLDNWVFNASSRELDEHTVRSVQAAVVSPLLAPIVWPGSTMNAPADRYVAEFPGMMDALYQPLACVPAILLVLTMLGMAALSGPLEQSDRPSSLTVFIVAAGSLEVAAEWGMMCRLTTDLQTRAGYDPHQKQLTSAATEAATMMAKMI